MADHPRLAIEPLYIFKFVVFGIAALVILVIASAAWFIVRDPGFRKDGGGDPELGLYLDRVDSIIHSVMAPELFDLVERLGELDEEFKALPYQSDEDAKIKPLSPAILDAVPGFNEGTSVLTHEHVSNWHVHREAEGLRSVVLEAACFRAFRLFAEGCARVDHSPEKYQELITWKDEPTLNGSTGRPTLYEALNEFYMISLDNEMTDLRVLAESHSLYRERLAQVEHLIARLRAQCAEEDVR